MADLQMKLETNLLIINGSRHGYCKGNIRQAITVFCFYQINRCLTH